MLSSRSVDFAPFLTFLVSGRVAYALLAVLMQSSLVFWPTAARWAREAREQETIHKLLMELSETHRPA